jgi:hypothetical protein
LKPSQPRLAGSLSGMTVFVEGFGHQSGSR